MNNKFAIWSLTLALSLSNVAFAITPNANNQENSKTSLASAVEQNSNYTANPFSKLTQKQELSPIEKIFNEPDAQNILNQFGYDVFDKRAFLSSNSKVSKNYKLNIGDKVDVFFWGDSIDLIAITGNEFLKSSNDLSVKQDGSIFIPGVGSILAKGKTVSTIEQDIFRILSAKFDKISLKVTLADQGNFPVIVTGNVKHKGTIYLNSNSTVLDALSLAGGVLKSGSLREVVYINGKTKSRLTLDLYDILLNGNLKTVKFNEGDIIFVKPIGKVAALKEGVKNPGIYEFKSTETLRHLIDYAGGLLPSVDHKIVPVESFDDQLGQKVQKDVPYKNLWYIKPSDGDSIAFKSHYNSSENFILVEGNVKHPGSFQYKPGMKLSDIINSENELLSQTFADQAVIERLTGINKDKSYIAISLKDFFNGYANPELKPQDKIKIFPSTTGETIEVSGYIINPGLIPYQDGLTLRKVLGSVRFGKLSAFEPVSNTEWNNYAEITTKNIVVEITSKTKKTAIPNSDELKNVSNKSSISAPDIEKNNTDYGNAQQNQEETNSNQSNKTQIVYLYDLIVKNNLKFDLPIYAGDQLIFRTLQPNETVEAVNVFGYVKSPGVFKYQDGMKLKDALGLANGLDKDGYLKGLVLLRPSIAADQKKNIEESLIKLQEEILLKVNTIQTVNNGTSNTEVQSFVNSQKELLDILREKAQKDYGRIMVNITSSNPEHLDEFENIELKPGDELYIPCQSNHIVVMGEALNNIAVTYKPKMSPDYYIKKVGGYTDQAKKNRVYVIKANGSVERLAKLNKPTMEPGDTIVIPKKVNIPINWLEVTRSVAQIAGNILSSIFILTKI